MRSNKQFDDLDTILTLYRETRRESPPDELDQRILAAARKNATIAPLPVKRRPRSPWPGPLALAATIVLSVGLVTLMQYELDQQAPMESSHFAPSAERSQDLGDTLKMAPQQPPPAAHEVAPAAARESLDSARQIAPAPPPAPALSPPPAALQTAPQDGETASESAIMEAHQDESLRAPDAWRDYILALQEQGQIEQARRELQNLRATYPEFQAEFPGLDE